MKRFFAAITLVFVACFVYPQAEKQYQDLVATLRQAAMEQDDSQRLARYDAIVKNLDIAENFSGTPGMSSQESTKWTFDKEIDPLTDKQRYFFILTADSGANEYGTSPTLVIRSDGEDLELYINWKTYLGNDTDDYKYEGKYITTRVDADQPATSLWDNSTDSKASFCPWNSVADLVKRMGDGAKFVVRCTPYDANPITAVFDIHGLKSVSMPYNEALGWWK